jgi:hypothetical protein
MLTLEAHWQGGPQCFGSPYICAIGDTVTGGTHACCSWHGTGRLQQARCAYAWEMLCTACVLSLALLPTDSPLPACLPACLRAGEKGTQGSLEYLVYTNVLVGVAAQYGLKPVMDYGDPQLAALFDRVRRRCVWPGCLCVGG